MAHPGTLAGVLGTGSRDRGRVELRRLQVTTVAGLDFPRATRAICGTRRVRQGGSRTWRTVTVDPGHQPAYPPGRRCPAGRLAWRVPGSRPQLRHVRDGPGA